MNRTATLPHRILRNSAALALASLLAIGASAARADDPYPPLDDEAQRIVDDAREQMYAIDFQRQAEKEGRLAAAALQAPAQNPELDFFPEVDPD
jgi:hypothetical protein